MFCLRFHSNLYIQICQSTFYKFFQHKKTPEFGRSLFTLYGDIDYYTKLKQENEW
jgi:hypothetical protein